MSQIKIEKNYETIQALRLIAAACVALTHATFYIKTRSNSSIDVWEVGSQGVQIFFVISGFVMALSSGTLTGNIIDWKDFILKRLIRIVPLYWLLNAIKIALLFIMPGALLAKPDVENIILSLLFIPSRNENGIIETFYGVGWTLNFEMFFYLIISIFLFLRLPIILFSTLALLVFLILSLFRQDEWPAISYLFHPYLANFIWGLLIAKLVAIKDVDKPFLGLILIVISSYLIFFDPIHPTMTILGSQYAALVLGMIMVEPIVRGRFPKIVLFGGDASYSLYLTHAMIGPAAVIIAQKMDIQYISINIIFTFTLMLIMASICHFFVERPIAKHISSWINHKKV